MYWFAFIQLGFSQSQVSVKNVENRLQQEDNTTISHAVAFIEQASETESSVAYVLQQLHLLVPEQMSLVEIKGEGGRYSVTALATDNMLISQLLTELENHAYFQDVYLNSIEQDEWYTHKVKYFTLQFGVDNPTICLPNKRTSIAQQRRQIIDSLPASLDPLSIVMQLKTINEQARQLKLQTDVFSPEPVIQYSGAIEGTPVQMSLQGTYEQIGQYLQQVASTNSLTSIENFKLTKVSDSPDKVQLDLKLVLLHPAFGNKSDVRNDSKQPTAAKCTDQESGFVIPLDWQFQVPVDPFYSFEQTVRKNISKREPLERYELTDLCISSLPVSTASSVPIRNPEEEFSASVGQPIGRNSGKITSIETIYRVVVTEEKTLASGEVITQTNYLYPCSEK
jgi:hypothetical protein